MRSAGFSKRLLSRVPGSLEALWSFNDFRQKKWGQPHWRLQFGNRLPELLREWQNDLATTGRLGERPGKKVLFVTGGIGIIEQSLATSFVLAHRNCEVDFVWYKNLLPDRPDDTYNQRKYRYYYARTLRESNHSGEHRITPLSSVAVSSLSPEMVEAARAQALIDVVYITRREGIDIEGEDKELYDYRIACNCDLMSRLVGVVERGKHDLMVTPNGAVLEYGAAYRLSQIIGLPAGTYEFWSGPGQGAASFGPNVWSHKKTDRMWEMDSPHELSPERRARAEVTLRKRAGSQRSGLGREQLTRELSLKPGKEIVLVCPNVPFDGMFLGKDSIFPSMRGWLIETVGHLASSHPGINIIVRSHPDEKVYTGGETTSAILGQELAKEILDRVYLVSAESSISTYDLMKIADLGLVYSSTTGLEMAAQGLPVICGNYWHYNGKGFTYDPHTRAEYFQLIDRIVADPVEFRLSSQQVDLALAYLDIFFNQLPMPFPWTFVDFWSELREWPVLRAMSPEGDAAFGEFFDQLIGISTRLSAP